MTLKLRFSLAFLGCICAVLAVYSGSYYFLERRQAVAQQRVYAKSELQKVVAACRDATLEGDWISALNHLKLVGAEPAVLFAECRDAHGRARAHSEVRKIGSIEDSPQPSFSDESSSFAEREYVEDGRTVWELSGPVRLSNRVDGVGRIAYDRAALDGFIARRLWSTLERLAAVSSATLLVGVAAAFLLAWSLARPIGELVHATEEIRAGHLAYRVPGAGRDDELGQLAGAFNEMARGLSELEELKQEFIDSVTHDLKQPLSIITAHIELMLQDPEGLSEVQLKWLRGSGESADRLANYINAILDYSRLKSGSFPIQKKRFSMAALAAEIGESFAVQAKAKDLRIGVRAPQGGAEVTADYELLHRVVSNLVANAIRYTPRGGSITIHVSAERARVRVAVEDTGVGIPEARLSQVFEKFVQLAPAGPGPRDAGHHGLGLTIAKQIVEEHGGSIGVRSEEGKGTIFFFELPVSPATEGAAG
jgi:signal transduction histidine kinase